MNLIFFYKCSKFYLDFEKRIKFAKNLMPLKKNWFEPVAGVSVNYEKNACDWLQTS